MALARTRMPRFDLVAGGSDDCAVARDLSAVRLRADGLGGERHGLSEHWNAQVRAQQARGQTRTVDPREFLKHPSRHSLISEGDFFITKTGIGQAT